MSIRFDPTSGKFVVKAHCAVAYEYVNNGVLVDEIAQGLGEAYLTPAQLVELTSGKIRAVSTWHHEDGRAFTLGCLSGDWQLVWHGKGQDPSRQLKVSQSGYREFVKARYSEGFRLMPLVEQVPPPPPTRY